MKRSLRTAFLVATAWAGVAGTAAAAPLSEAEPVIVKPQNMHGESAVNEALTEAGYDARALGALVLVQRHRSDTSGRTYLRYEQRLGTVPVHGTFVRATLEEDGTLSQIAFRLADLDGKLPHLLPAVQERSASDAVGRAFGVEAPLKGRDEARLTFDKGEFYAEDPIASRVLIADTNGSLEFGYLVETWAKDSNELLHSLVDARGQVVDTELRTADDSYIAYKISPAHGNPTVIRGSAADSQASPQGWLRDNTNHYDRSIAGYNVHAYVDRNKDNSPDSSSRIYDLIFGVVPNLSKSATDVQNQRAAVQNLFYQVNAIHDSLYKYGFTETAGNFQYSNYSRGGVGGDFVRAEAVDGSGTNNANFATPVRDGGTPRMQMYAWTYTNPSRNSSYDGDIVWHEYSHGLTWRMVGQMDGPVSGALGEGMSDAIAAIMTDDDRIGEWAMNRADGIRTVRYRNFNKTLADFTGSSKHRDGEIWAAAMWRTWELFKAKGKSRDLLMNYIVDGLANTAPGPSYISMRDGLLAGSRGADDCLVWQAFAEFGMGEGAEMTRSGGKSSIRTSRRVPDGCSDADTTSNPDGGDLTLSYGSVTGEKGNPGKWYVPAIFEVKDGGQAVSGAKIVVEWSNGKTSSCETKSNGRCDAQIWGLDSTDPDVKATVKTINGKSVSAASGVPLTYTAENPYQSSSSSSGLVLSYGSVTGEKGNPGRWYIPSIFEVKEGGRTVSGAKIVVSWSNGKTSACETNSNGRCDAQIWGLSSNDPDVRATVKTINGKAAVAASGVSLTYTAKNPYTTSTSGVVLSYGSVTGKKGNSGRWYVPSIFEVKKDGRLLSGAKIVVAWSNGKMSSCETGSKGRCDAEIWGLRSGSGDVKATVKTINGKAAVAASGVALTYTAKNPYNSSATAMITSASVRGKKGNPGKWYAPAIFEVKKAGSALSNAKVVVGWSNGETSSCRTGSRGRCDAEIWGLRSTASNVRATVKTINGQKATAASGVGLSFLARNPYR